MRTSGKRKYDRSGFFYFVDLGAIEEGLSVHDEGKSRGSDSKSKLTIYFFFCFCVVIVQDVTVTPRCTNLRKENKKIRTTVCFVSASSSDRDRHWSAQLDTTPRVSLPESLLTLKSFGAIAGRTRKYMHETSHSRLSPLS